MRSITVAEAYEAVEKFDAMGYFQQVTAAARALLAQEILDLVNTPDGRPLRNSHGAVITVPPVERLHRFVRVFVRIPGGWPGISEMGALYQQMFPPGDGKKRPTPTIEGFTGEDNASGNYIALSDPAAEPLQIEAPEPMPEADRRDLSDKFSILRRKMIAGSE